MNATTQKDSGVKFPTGLTKNLSNLRNLLYSELRVTGASAELYPNWHRAKAEQQPGQVIERDGTRDYLKIFFFPHVQVSKISVHTLMVLWF